VDNALDNISPASRAQQIKEQARALGFDLVGITRARALDDEGARDADQVEAKGASLLFNLLRA